ncbi:unnamed protein product [Danaus chrysippus]|uniref:(African queen) hypothetical protein n=1 Tax=Danaus chrysippus TaxID=151541 RepID=A0A8J2QU75_9NEOP|nr:unnamed protein product [Danaus chrysippus]
MSLIDHNGDHTANPHTLYRCKSSFKGLHPIKSPSQHTRSSVVTKPTVSPWLRTCVNSLLYPWPCPCSWLLYPIMLRHGGSGRWWPLWTTSGIPSWSAVVATHRPRRGGHSLTHTPDRSRAALGSDRCGSPPRGPRAPPPRRTRTLNEVRAQHTQPHTTRTPGVVPRPTVD